MTNHDRKPPLGHFLARRATSAVEEALADTRVVLINGARQSGKSTLVRKVGKKHGAAWYSLDDSETRKAAADDVSGFVRLDPVMIIDEVQRFPDLFLSIKALVDEDPRPGRFLLTGSSRVLAMRHLPDTLVGRMETIELWPLSQGEIDGAPDAFVDAAFALGPDLRHDSDLDRNDYIERLVRGGFPEAIARTERRRERFLDSYVADMINRDVMQLSEIAHGHEMRTLVQLLAGRSGQILVPSAIANDLEISQQTVTRYLGMLEEVFLIKRIPAWTRNLRTRAIGKSKVALVDSGLAANVLDLDASSMRRIGSPFGGLLEAFVAMEVARQLTWSTTRAEMYHYRTRDQVEVDIILENRRGQVIAIEVKASSTPSGDDFRGIRHLEERLGDDLVAGYVLHTGRRTLPFGPKFRAIPVSALWEVTPPT
ncbi:ATP-binding protein [Promicromonospora soli]